MSLIATTPDSPRLSRREIAIVGVLAVVGVVGAWLALAQLAEMRAELNAVQKGTGPEIAQLRAEAGELRRQSEKAQARVSASMPPPAAVVAEPAAVARADRMAALLTWARLVTRGGGASILAQRSMMDSLAAARARNPNIPVPPVPGYLLSSSYQVPPRFGELFDLRDEQVAQFQQGLTQAYTRVNELVAANTRVRENGDGSYTLEVTAVPEAAIAAERDRMMATMRQVLGDDGYRAFELLNGDMGNPQDTRNGPRNFFNAFGTIERVATISKNPQGGYRYEMTYGPGGRASGGAQTLEVLEGRIGGAVKLLPAGF